MKAEQRPTSRSPDHLPTTWIFGSDSHVQRALVCGVLAIAALSAPAGVVAAHNVLRRSVNKVEDWLPPSMPDIQQWLWFQQHFKGDEVLVVTWPGCTLREENLDTLVARARNLKDDSGQPLFHRVVSGRELFRDLTSPPISLPDDVAKQRLRGWIVGPDGESTCAVLMVDTSRSPDRRRAVAEIMRIAEVDCGLSRHELRIGGPTADSVFIDKASVNSLYVLSLICVLLGVLLAWVFLRDAVLVTATFTTALLAEAYIVIVIHWSGATMDAVMTMVPLLVYVLTICASMHFMNAYRVQLRQSPRPLLATVGEVWRPTTWAIVTTAVGLASLMVSDLIPIQRFGFFGAVGVMLSLLVMLVYQTAFLAFMGMGKSRRLKERHVALDATPAWLLRWALALSKTAMRRSTAVLVSAVLVAIVLGAGTTRLTTSAKIRDMFTPGSRELQDYRWIEQHVAPLVPIDVVLCFPHDDGLTVYERAICADGVRERVAGVPLLTGVTSPASFLPELHHGGGARNVMRRAAMNAKLKSERSRLVSGGLIADTPDEELWLISGRAAVFSDVDYDDVVAEVRTHVLAELQDPPRKGKTPVRAVVCGGIPVIATVQKQLLHDLRSSLGASVVMIGGFLAVGLRSIRSAVVLLIPNVFPVLFLFGFMGWLGIAVDLGSMLTISTALGIAVDNELHFIAHFRQLCQAGFSREEAVAATLQHCTAPILQSAVISGAGMLVLTLSPFLPTVRFGGIMCLLMIAAVLGDLVLLPAILKSPLGTVFTSSTSKGSLQGLTSIES